MDSKIKIIFAGTGLIACPLLESLKEDERFEIVLVVSQEDRPAGRKMELTPPPVKKTAIELKLPVFQPKNVNDEKSLKILRETYADLMVVMAYGQIVSGAVLKIPRKGCVNVHTSLLPKFRGASPIQSALLAMEKKTGITLIKMEEKMDTGPIYEEYYVRIESDDNAIILTQKLATETAHKIPDALFRVAKERLSPTPQDEKAATYCHKIGKTDGDINWNEEIDLIDAKIRAFAGWPGSSTWLNGKRLKILEAKKEKKNHKKDFGTIFLENGILQIAAKKGVIIPSQVQIEGKKAQNINEFINGNPDFINSKLTSKP